METKIWDGGRLRRNLKRANARTFLEHVESSARQRLL